MKKKLKKLSTTHLIMLSFLAVILTGSILLALPVSSADGKAVPYIDALFTATTSTCVTGLVTLTTSTAWSTFGHIVILTLIQIGGLGLITVISGIMLAFQKKMSIGSRILIQDAFNLNTMSGLAQFVKKVLIGTFTVEAVGAALYMIVFVPRFGLRGVWISIFNSISAFCNAGIDIFAENSLCDYATNPIVNFVTCALIILGGIGYIVWWDVLRVTKLFKKQKHRYLRNLTLHSKIAISATFVLIILGAVVTFLFEYNNPDTIKNFTLLEKIQFSFFQSVTTRTAGFATVPQENLTSGSALFSMILMFIGGSPVGTAGGVKTVTIVTLLVSAYASVSNKNEATIFHRSLSESAVRKAVAVSCVSFFTLLVSTLLMCATTDASLLDILYETTSATATVGLTRNLTSSLNIWGKIIIIATMYLGRVGPISLAVAFTLKKDNQNLITTPTENISVG